MNESESELLRFLCQGESPDVCVRLGISEAVCLPTPTCLLLFANWAKEEGDLKSSKALCLMAIKASKSILEEAIDLLQDG